MTVLASGGYRMALPLSHAGRPVLVAVGDIPALTAASEPERARLQKWAQAVAERLRLTDQLYARGGVSAAPVSPPPAPGQAALAWEALLTLDHLIRRTRIHRESARTVRRILEGAFALLQVRTLIWVPSQPDATPVVLGEACLTPGEAREAAASLTKLAGETTDPILCNDVREALGGRFARIFNLLALPVADLEPPGWVIAVNKRGTPARRARTETTTTPSAPRGRRSRCRFAAATPPC